MSNDLNDALPYTYNWTPATIVPVRPSGWVRLADGRRARVYFYLRGWNVSCEGDLMVDTRSAMDLCYFLNRSGAVPIGPPMECPVSPLSENRRGEE